LVPRQFSANHKIVTKQAKTMSRPASRLFPAHRNQQIDGLVRQIADASLPPARRRISSEAMMMSSGELRGYLRARAVLDVRDYSRRMAAAHHLDGTFTEQLVERALERTVNLLQRELAHQLPRMIPTYEALPCAAA
jgi:hypothetical protein